MNHKKNNVSYVVDTSTFLAYGNKVFEVGDLIIPISVLMELEQKKGDRLLGHMARNVMRKLDSGLLNSRELSKNTVMFKSNNNKIVIETNMIDTTLLPKQMRDDTQDSFILAVAKNYHDDIQSSVVLLTQDTAMRVKAMSMGVKAIQYSDLKEEIEFDDRGYLTNSDLEEKEISNIFSKNYETITKYPENIGFVLSDKMGKNSSIFIKEKNELIKVSHRANVSGIKPKSNGQKIAIHHLENDCVPIVSLAGPAGTGKSLLALAAGWKKLKDNKSTINKIIVFRNLYEVGQQKLGFLPGDSEEKMSPWAAAVFDVLEDVATKTEIKEAIEREQIEILPLTHIRGRTFKNSWVIVDEAQNLECVVLLSVMTRLGVGSQIVLTWDAKQRDNIFMSSTEGPPQMLSKMRGSELFAHVGLTKTERSKLSEEVSKRMGEN